MSNIEPYVIVNDVTVIKKPGYGEAGKIALVGAFPTSTVNVDVYTDSTSARNALKGEYRLPEDNDPAHASQSVVPSEFVSFYCLDYIFAQNKDSNGAESVLVVNTNFGKSTLEQSVTNSSLANACTLLKEEDFDILTIADNVKLAVENSGSYILNPMWSTLKTFTDTMFKSQKPCGVITGVLLDENCNISLVQGFKNLWKDKGFYKAVCTPVCLSGETSSLSIAQSGCWHSSFTSGRSVNKSETSKVYEGIKGEDSKTKYPLTSIVTWKNLLDNGFHTTKYRNRKEEIIQCLNNVTPADYDMKVERVKNYMIKRLTLANYLGEDNNRKTRGVIETNFENERQLAISNGYLIDMVYDIVPVDTNTVKAKVKFVIADIITVIELDTTIEISNDIGA